MSARGQAISLFRRSFGSNILGKSLSWSVECSSQGARSMQPGNPIASPTSFLGGCMRGMASASGEVVQGTQRSNATLEALKHPNEALSYDQTNHPRYPAGDPSKRAFTYFVLSGGRFIYASAIRLAVLKFVLSMTASKDVLAMASLEVDVSNVQEDQTITVKWRGKPVFIRRRSEDAVSREEEVPMEKLRDPQPDEERRLRPDWLVVVGVCTHLGCVPIADAGDFNGWFCPCHGSHYDGAGRIRKGPGPANLEVPPYKFLSESKILLG